MKKVLPIEKTTKRFPEKLVDLLSGIGILVTICILLTVSALTLKYNNRTIRANGYAIYKGNTEKEEVAMMFNVYEGEENVMKILSILRKYSVKATFFIGGIWAQKHPDLVLEIMMQGHEIGNHGYLHRDHSKMSIEQNKEEIAITANLLENITGNKITLFAPPSGAFGENTEIACKDLGQKMILWSKDTIDWRDNNVDLIVQRATRNVTNGDLILMHPKNQTVSALPSIIESYLFQGFAPVTVSETIS